MYFPYLRGRQFEMIALRELVDEEMDFSKITPIIEPVNLSSSFQSSLKKLSDVSKVVVIINSTLSNLDNYDLIEFLKTLKKENIVLGLLIGENISECDELKKEFNFAVIHTDNEKNNLDVYKKNIFGKLNIEYNLMGFESISYNRKLKNIDKKQNHVLLREKFKKQVRNADYLNVDEEFFSDDHLYYEDEGFIGFSDYSVIGNNYNQGGFAARAVSIHILTKNNDNELHIRHFTSISNGDVSNPGDKFKEALKKLVNLIDKDILFESNAILEFKKLFEISKYPGLGVVKKLSIKHHLQLMVEVLK